AGIRPQGPNRITPYRIGGDPWPRVHFPGMTAGRELVVYQVFCFSVLQVMAGLQDPGLDLLQRGFGWCISQYEFIAVDIALSREDASASQGLFYPMLALNAGSEHFECDSCIPSPRAGLLRIDSKTAKYQAGKNKPFTEIHLSSFMMASLPD